MGRIFSAFVTSATILAASTFLFGAAAAAKEHAEPLPVLQKNHGAWQLMVAGKPFMVLGGELENSTPSDRSYLRQYWNSLQKMHLNTVITPVSWELIEPQEGKFDFRSVDFLIADARAHNMRLVILWFGSWKNSMSSYAPSWVKRDMVRFPRSRDSQGKAQEILSPYSRNNLAVDARAFKALMAHIRDTDAMRRTVITVQVENEIGMLPQARDHSPEADAAFKAPVPSQLTDYLRAHKDTLTPEILTAWQEHGFKTSAPWEDTFGAGIATDEMFNAWSQALYTEGVAKAGKAVYPLPMYANAALIRPGRKPGEYPSGGPLPHLYEIWKAAAPSLDFLSPDLYFPNFVEWASKYARADNPFFIPETGRVNGAEMGANAFFAFGALKAMGYSPYAPEYLSTKDAASVGAAYDILGQMAPAILSAQGTGRILGIRAAANFDNVVDMETQTHVLGDYSFRTLFKEPPPTSIGAKPEDTRPGAHGGLIIQTGPDEFIIAGTGMIVFFSPADNSGDTVGIDWLEEGGYVNGVWKPGRRINGDLSNQARHLRLPLDEFSLRRVRLYRYH